MQARFLLSESECCFKPNTQCLHRRWVCENCIKTNHMCWPAHCHLTFLALGTLFPCDVFSFGVTFSGHILRLISFPLDICICELFWNRKRLRIHPDVHYSICAVSCAQLHDQHANVHNCKCGNDCHPALMLAVCQALLWV